MRIQPLANCGVEISDVDITQLTNSDYKKIQEILYEHLIVIIRRQSTNPYHYARLIHNIGKIANWNQCVWNTRGEMIRNFGDNTFDIDSWHGDPEEFPIQRVTGKKINEEATGIFGEGKLDWHCNMNGPDRARGVALQAVSEGAVGTSTSYMDTTLAYAALSPELKQRCENVIGHFQYAPNIWAEGLSKFQYDFMMRNNDQPYDMPLVNKSMLGDKLGLYFHYMNKCTFPQDPELLEILKEHCFQDRFIFKHVYEMGDISLSDQLITLHKRDVDDPNVLSERILHRFTFHFE
jgi:alpha-ketoglutarate-dependent taurine dioxygenase